ncbi:Methyltransferase, FkbM family [Flavobacterium daejeonense]|nr:Methyltransferase, FkbM family [Flavobacterium daejeonense]
MKIVRRVISKIKLIVAEFLKKKYSYSEKLLNDLKKNDRILIVEEDGVPFKVSFEELFFYVNTREEAFILKELLKDNDYDFTISDDVVVVDIGMNVGFTSLFFSKKENVKKIYSFEPVLETYEFALKNLELNSKIANKISAYNFGIGGNNYETEFIFSTEYKGSVGVRGLKSWNIRIAKDRTIVKVQIKDASEVLTPIFDNHKEVFFVCKLDCEGAEYEILENIEKTGVIKKVNLLIIEYHDKGFITLRDILSRNGFVVIIKKTANHLGIIYAFNVRNVN